MRDKFIVSSSPHIRHIDTTSSIMLDVIIALCPAAIYGCILFGWRAVILLLSTVASAVLSEFAWCKLTHKPNTIGDLSAVVTGLLLGMNLSSLLPFWMAIIGSAVAVIVVKQMFGGLGHNFANPAITARIVLLVSFPAAMTKYAPVFSKIDTVTSATPLAQNSDEVIGFTDLFFGRHGGCIGETSAFLLLVGGVYLVLRRVISPIIPVSFIGTVALMALVFDVNISVYVFGGGLMLGAIFMATDYTTSPTTPLGKLIFGIGCGAIAFVIRKWSNLPEGVSYAILLMNILTPHINTLTKRKPFGVKEAAKNE